MAIRPAVGTALLVGLVACGSNGEQATAAAATSAGAPVAASAADATTTAKTAAGPAAAAAAQPEGARGYDNSVQSAMDAVRALYAPYMTAGTEPRSDMDPRPDYSTAFNRAITAWRAATADAGATNLSEAGWICGCQDWDASRARLTMDHADATARGYDVVARFSADGSGDGTEVLFSLIEQDGRWKVDDMVLGADQRTVRALLADETRTGG